LQAMSIARRSSLNVCDLQQTHTAHCIYLYQPHMLANPTSMLRLAKDNGNILVNKRVGQASGVAVESLQQQLLS
jgi:hypothetical protein